MLILLKLARRFSPHTLKMPCPGYLLSPPPALIIRNQEAGKDFPLNTDTAEATMKADSTSGSDDYGTSFERYLQMNEKEKDAEIEKAVARLQKRIQEIVYLPGDETRKAKPPQNKDKKLP